jgi:ATP-dependent helicase HrpA
MRLDKLRADPARDGQRLAELRPLEQRYQRRLAELKGRPTAGWRTSAGSWRSCA